MANVKIILDVSKADLEKKDLYTELMKLPFVNDVVIGDIEYTEEDSEDVLCYLDRAYDFLCIMINSETIEQAFEKSIRYCGFTNNEFEDTLKALDIKALADLYRAGENLHQRNMNGEYYNYNFTGENVKEVVITYLNKYVTDKADQEEFYRIINSMAC